MADEPLNEVNAEDLPQDNAPAAENGAGGDDWASALAEQEPAAAEAPAASQPASFAELGDGVERPAGQSFDGMQVIEPEARGALEVVTLAVGAGEGDVVKRALVGVVSPDGGADRAVSEADHGSSFIVGHEGTSFLSCFNYTVHCTAQQVKK